MKKISTALLLIVCLLCTALAACSEDKPIDIPVNDMNSAGGEEAVSGTSEPSESDESSETVSDDGLLTFDFANAVTVKYSGLNKYGVAELTVSPSVPPIVANNVSLKLSSSENLSNGQVISLRISYDANTMRNNGYKIANDNIEFTVYGLEELKVVDAFEGLVVDFHGVSPFCTATINNAQCSEEAQLYVTYTVEEGAFANDDVVVVTASIPEEVTLEHGYVLDETKTTKEFTVSNMPYYITNLDGIDTTLLVSELKDYVTAEISFDSKKSLFSVASYKFQDTYGNYNINMSYSFKDVESVVSSEAKLLTIKATSLDKFISGDLKTYNSLRVVAKAASVTDRVSDGGWHTEGDIFLCFSINNIIVYPDGTVAWGNETPVTYDIGYSSTLNGIDTVKELGITSNAVDYNINNVEKTDWINIVE